LPPRPGGGAGGWGGGKGWEGAQIGVGSVMKFAYTLCVGESVFGVEGGDISCETKLASTPCVCMRV